MINPKIFNLGVWYRIVSTTSFCGHVLGGKPYHCLRNKEPDCQKQCTLSEWCIGYARRHNSCALMTSSGVCPSSWEKTSGHVARSEGDLVATYSDDWVCKSKKGIKSMKWLKYFFRINSLQINKQPTYTAFSGITCQCKNITTLEGNGNCLKPSNKHNAMSFCYVIQPSSCSDLEEDDAFNGEKLSAEACKSRNMISAKQLPPQKGYVTF